MFPEYISTEVIGCDCFDDFKNGDSFNATLIALDWEVAGGAEGHRLVLVKKLVYLEVPFVIVNMRIVAQNAYLPVF